MHYKWFIKGISFCSQTFYIEGWFRMYIGIGYVVALMENSSGYSSLSRLYALDRRKQG